MNRTWYSIRTPHFNRKKERIILIRGRETVVSTPKFWSPGWDRTPPHTSGGFCAHFNYTLRLVDWMVEHKMNVGIPDVPWLGTDAIFNVVPGINDNATQGLWIEARLQELHRYMEARHVQYVPMVHSPDGNSLFDPRMVEGTWLRNASFTFDRVTGVAAPTTASMLASELNGDFANLGAGGPSSQY